MRAQEVERRKTFRLAAVRKVVAQLQRAQRVAHQTEAMVQELRDKVGLRGVRSCGCNLFQSVGCVNVCLRW